MIGFDAGVAKERILRTGVHSVEAGVNRFEVLPRGFERYVENLLFARERSMIAWNNFTSEEGSAVVKHLPIGRPQFPPHTQGLHHGGVWRSVQTHQFEGLWWSSDDRGPLQGVSRGRRVVYQTPAVWWLRIRDSALGWSKQRAFPLGIRHCWPQHTGTVFGARSLFGHKKELHHHCKGVPARDLSPPWIGRSKNSRIQSLGRRIQAETTRIWSKKKPSQHHDAQQRKNVLPKGSMEKPNQLHVAVNRIQAGLSPTNELENQPTIIAALMYLKWRSWLVPRKVFYISHLGMRLSSWRKILIVRRGEGQHRRL